MADLSPVSASGHSFLRDCRGNIAIMFGLMLVPLALVTGVGVDFARALDLKNTLQGSVDAAALAGASVYNDSSDASNATTVATDYMNNSISHLPSGGGVSFAVTPQPDTSGNGTIGYTVAVTARATVANTFMSMAGIDTTPVSVTAKAEKPAVIANVDLHNFTSSACDGNTLYWYLIPATSNASTYVPSNSNLTELWTNTVPNPPPPAPIPLSSSSQQIGFALKNVTGQLCNYGSNQYGGRPGSTHMFYSNLFPPSSIAYRRETQNRSLQVAPLPAGQTQSLVAGNLPQQGFNQNFANAAPSCGSLNNQTFVYAWNDMGGPQDDLDYNDAVFSFSCPGGGGGQSGSTASGVFLVQ